MSRKLLGPGILAGLLLLGLLTGLAMEKSCRPAEEALAGAAQAAMQEDWKTADALTRRARASWEQSRKLHSCLNSQEDVEEIDSRFDCLSVYAGEIRGFSAACLSLEARLRALRQAHGWELWHFL